MQNKLNGPGLNMVVTLAQTLPHGFANLLSASYEVEHISLSPQTGQASIHLTVLRSSMTRHRLVEIRFQARHSVHRPHRRAARTSPRP